MAFPGHRNPHPLSTGRIGIGQARTSLDLETRRPSDTGHCRGKPPGLRPRTLKPGGSRCQVSWVLNDEQGLSPEDASRGGDGHKQPPGHRGH